MTADTVHGKPFANWLLARMTERCWTRNQTAQFCNVSVELLRSWLSGQHKPPLAKIRVIAWSFGVSELEVYCAIVGVTDDQLRAELARRVGSPDACARSVRDTASGEPKGGSVR